MRREETCYRGGKRELSYSPTLLGSAASPSEKGGEIDGSTRLTIFEEHDVHLALMIIRESLSHPIARAHGIIEPFPENLGLQILLVGLMPVWAHSEALRQILELFPRTHALDVGIR